jgi:hypothetical protein
MEGRRSVWPAFLSGLAGLGLIVAGMALPWVEERDGATVPWRAFLPWDLNSAQAQSMLTSIALPVVVAAGFCLVAILVRVRGLAISLAFVVLGLEVAWFASESFRRNGAGNLLAHLEIGAWLALLGAILVMIGAFLTPRWEPQVR